MADITTIQIQKETRNALKQGLRKSETYDTGIMRLLKQARVGNQPTLAEDTTSKALHGGAED